MIFDSWGGVLADGAFQQFSLAYTARVLAQLKRTRRGRPDRAAHRLHQGRRPVAAGHEGAGLRGAGPGLDGEPGHGARDRRWRRGRPGQGAAGQHRPQRAVCPARGDRRGSGARARQLRPARTPTAAPPARPTSSTWATASASTPRPRTWRCWWKRCTPTRARNAPEATVRRNGRCPRAQNRRSQAFLARNCRKIFVCRRPLMHKICVAVRKAIPSEPDPLQIP